MGWVLTRVVPEGGNPNAVEIHSSHTSFDLLLSENMAQSKTE
jgi:hypothetical protein